MSSVETEVLQGISAGLRPAEKAYMDCPVCLGGQNRDQKTFMIVRGDDVNTVYYRCFRAKCAVAGAVTEGRPKAIVETTQPVRTRRRTFTGDFHELDPALRQCLTDKIPYVMALEPAWRMTDDWRVAMPLQHYWGKRIGWQLRSYELSSPNLPKAEAYMDEDITPMSFAVPIRPACDGVSTEHSLVLVEDIPSALMVSAAGWPACALLGTELTNEKLHVILQDTPTHELLIALDPDARKKSFQIWRDVRGLFSLTKVVLFPKDPKDLPVDVVRETLARTL
jgi:hypothetical protein